MGERGVAAFTAAALDLGWFVRRQHESDQGIDAEVEKVNFVKRNKGPDKEVSTGRLIAVQIKSGESWFSRPTKTAGWWFSFSERERNLWLNHALPVIVVMYHPVHQVVYWQRISAATIKKTSTRYRVEVPAAQVLASAGDAWNEIASGDERRAESRFELSLQGVSPKISKSLSARSLPEHADAAILAMHLSEGRKNPRGTAAALLSAHPRWIAENAEWAWGLLATFCSDHDELDLAADAYELAAQASSGVAKTRTLVAAATYRAGSDSMAATALMEQADASGGEPVLRAVGRTVVARFSEALPTWTLDPLLLAGGPDVQGSVAAQRLLSAEARTRSDLDAAVRHAEIALGLEPDSSETMVMTADCRLARWSTQGASPTDLSRAIELLRQALAQRTAWAGAMTGIRRDLARCLAMAGDSDAVLRLALPPPGGAAELTDLDPVVLRIAASIANDAGQVELRDQAVALLGDAPEDRLAKVRVGALVLSADEVANLRLDGFAAAERDGQYTELAQHGLALCSEGVDVVERLRPHVDAGRLPPSMLGLCEALVLAEAGGLDRALPSLRELAKADAIAAEHLLGRLMQERRFTEAAQQARQLFQITRAAPYLAHEARALIGGDDIEGAVGVANEAIALTGLGRHDRAELLMFLGSVAGERKDWALGEQYFGEALELAHHPSPSLLWNLVVCLVNQGRIAKAAQVVAVHRPQVRDVQDAELWLLANASSVWDERTAFEAFALAQRFDDPKLSTALVGAIVTRTHGVASAGEDDDDLEERRRAAQAPVPGELHRQAFEFIEKLVERYGDETGIKVMKGNDAELLNQMVEQLQVAAAADSALREVAEMVRDGAIPLGVLAAGFNRCHATLEIQRAIGIRLAGAVADDEHALEVEAAATSLNTTVVVDAASVVTLTGLRDPHSLAGRFTGLWVPPSVMLDLHRLSDDVRGMAGSPGSLRWDERLQQVVATDLSDDEFMRLLARAESVEAYVDRLVVRSPGAATVYAELRRDETQAPWLDALQLATDHGLVLWSDDLGMRRAGRAVGVASFGTPALVDAMRDVELDASTTSADDDAAIDLAVERNLELAADYVVDLVLGVDGVLLLAEREGWEPRAAAVAISRPSFWLWNESAPSAIRSIYGDAKQVAPDALAGWQLAAMHGAARLAQPEAAAAVLAVLALLGFGDNPDDRERADALRRARGVADDLGLPDPAGGLPRAARLLAEGGECEDPEGLVRRVLALLETPEGDTE